MRPVFGDLAKDGEWRGVLQNCDVAVHAAFDPEAGPRLAARGTAWARAQVATLRLQLLKIGVQVIASVRRIVLRLPAAFPYRDGWRAVALRSGASPG